MLGNFPYLTCCCSIKIAVVMQQSLETIAWSGRFDETATASHLECMIMTRCLLMIKDLRSCTA
jgi:hypothetical protein